MVDFQSNNDFGDIRITPNIQDRINEMRRRKAEERADRNERIAMEAHRATRCAQAEANRCREANIALLCQLHAALGWPRRTLLPAPGKEARDDL